MTTLCSSPTVKPKKEARYCSSVFMSMQQLLCLGSGDKWRWHHQFLDVPGMFGLLYSDIVWFNIFKDSCVLCSLYAVGASGLQQLN
ncbi:hypothetical protein ZEAMMB73_Zm00001d041311 [Zea mays]|uniref:Uncharacterized protein n=1 Tax=Zea mays TaxID=4577 RepID=A0A1D6MVG4_MAIZE|nr:hypothetical protein ZEAMMB73_Zm00001d041311 [Zea mays]